MKKTTAILTIFLLISVVTMLLFPQTSLGVSQPSISGIWLSPGFQNASEAKTVTITVNTVNAPQLTAVTVQLVQGTSRVPVSGIGVNPGIIINNIAQMVMNIPSNLKAGEYEVKAVMYIGGTIYENTAKYKVYPVNIPAASVVPQSHTEGNAQTVIVKIYADVINGTNATVSLRDSAGNAVPGVTPALLVLNGNYGEAELTISSSVESGEYRIKVDILGVSDSSATYYILASSDNLDQTPDGDETSGPVITGIWTSDASLAEGSVSGEIVITGSNFSSDVSGNSLQIVDNTSGKTVFSQLIPSEASAAYLKVPLPASIKEGVYSVRVTTGGKAAVSLVTFAVDPPEPVMEAIEFPQDVSLIFGSISGNITVKGKYFSTAISENAMQFVDNNGNAAASSIVTSSSTTAITAPIPHNLTTGNYKVRVTMAGKSVTSSEAFTVYNSASALGIPQITGVTLSNSPLAAGSITGNIIINGTGFITGSSVYIIDSSSGVTAASVDPTSVTIVKITAAVPVSLPPGSYRIKVVNGSVYDTSESVFTILEPSGGEDGGDGGGGFGPLPGSQDPPVVTVEIGDELTVLTDSSENVAYIEVDGALMDEKLAETEGKEGKPEIFLRFPDNELKDRMVIIKEDAVASIANGNADFRIQSSDMQFTIPGSLFKEYKDKGAQLEINLIVSEGSSIGNDMKKALANTTTGASVSSMSLLSGVADVKIYTVTGTGNDRKELTAFKDKLTIRLNVSSADIMNADTKKLGVYYFDEVGKKWVYTGGRYDAVTGDVISKTAHLSRFAVIEFNKTFSDVKSGYWGKEYIEILASRHISTGVTSEKFQPLGSVTKAQFATFIVRALDLQKSVFAGRYTDVGRNHWAVLYVEAASDAGILAGLDTGGFKPDDSITREQMALMIMNAYNYSTGNSIDTVAAGVQLKFADMGMASSWAVKPIKAAYRLGIINGISEREYSPKGKAQRAQAAAMIIRLLQLLGEI